MTPILLFSILALVTASQGGTAEIDKGVIDGLRTGDVGVIFYVLRVNQQERRIEVGKAEVFEAGDFVSRLQLREDVRVSTGFSVEFDLDPSRWSAATLAEEAEKRVELNQLDLAIQYLTRALAAAGETGPILSRIEELRSRQERLQWLEREQANLPSYREQAAEHFTRGDLEAARSSANRIIQVSPHDPAALFLLERIRLEEEKRRNSARVPGAVYAIGRELNVAAYYNQQPLFTVRLPAFWIDRSLVTNAEFSRFPSEFTFPEGEDFQAAEGMTFDEAEAYCRWIGKRLPTEFEVEAAASLGALENVPETFEWTRSWYQPYPGNVVWEEDYGERFRVIRSACPELRHERTYMAPGARASDVGFRCVREEAVSEPVQP